MLELALEAKLPLVSVHTDDTLNVGKVLSAVACRTVPEYQVALKAPILKEGLYYTLFTDHLDYKDTYTAFDAQGATLVVVNPPTPYSGAFDAGVLTTPPKMIQDFVKQYGTPDNYDGLTAALAGLNFEQMFQISKMAMAKHQEYTPRAVRDVRRTFFGTVRGLQMLSTGFFHYTPAPAIEKWLASSGSFLTTYDEPLLTPRGLLFNGPPGTGKTMGAKYIARELDLPLYHLDIASLMERYVGASENNLKIALKQAEVSAPCVMLIDEVEKMFKGGSDDSGVTSRMLSSILWWLQEHKSKVFTVMTTNKEADIPPELYREGRIDSEINFSKMNIVDAVVFGHTLTKKMEKELGLSVMPPESADFKGLEVSHAEVTQIVTQKVKKAYINQQKED